MNPPTSHPRVRPPGCPALVFIGPGHAYGFCTDHEHHVSLGVADACLCDHCTPDACGKHHIDRDVYFHGHDLVGLHSARHAMLEQAISAAAAIHCSPKAPEPAIEAKPAPKAKPRPAAATPKPGLLAFS